MPTGDVDGVVPDAVRPTVVSLAVLSAMCLGTIVLSAMREDVGVLATGRLLTLAVPGAFLAMAMSLSHISGQLDLSLGAVFGTATTVLSLSGSPSDWQVVAVGAGAIAMVMVAGSIVGRHRYSTVAGLVLYFVVAELGRSIAGGHNRFSEVDDSALLRFFNETTFGVGHSVAVLAVAVAALYWMLFRTGLGLRVRADGRYPEAAQSLASSTTHARLAARLVVGALVALAAVLVFANSGTDVDGSGRSDLLYPVAAVIIGSGGIGLDAPSPLRVGTAAIALYVLSFQVAAIDTTRLAPSAVTGILALITLGLGALRWNDAAA